MEGRSCSRSESNWGFSQELEDVWWKIGMTFGCRALGTCCSNIIVDSGTLKSVCGKGVEASRQESDVTFVNGF